MQVDITLIRESPQAHGVGEDPQEKCRTMTGRKVSVGQKEFYEAMAHGLKPEMKIILPWVGNYRGEKLCRVWGKRYRITRTYETETNEIELTLTPVTGVARGEAATDA